MPMDRARYPKNWEEIAHQVKQAAGWRCQECDRPCRPPNMSWFDFQEAIETQESGWSDDLFEEVEDEEFGLVSAPRFTRFVLTVAHLDQDPGNNDPANLKALCSVCHLRHDAPYREANRRAKLERRGQLNLLEVGKDG